MGIKHVLLRVVFIGLLAYTCISVNSSNGIKNAPEYTGVDPRVQDLVKEYKELAKTKGIIFKKEVTIGFKKINNNMDVGETTITSDWREIDVDIDYWERSNSVEKICLMFHELTHAYCGRLHTYGDNVEYKIEDMTSGDFKNGYYKEDKCPLSLLFPYIINTKCVEKHYNDYINEMFNNCKPY